MIPRSRQHAVVHGAESCASDAKKMKALKWQDCIRGQIFQNPETVKNLLTVGLNGFAPNGTRRSSLALQNQNRNAALGKRQPQDSAPASRSHYDDVEPVIHSCIRAFASCRVTANLHSGHDHPTFLETFLSPDASSLRHGKRPSAHRCTWQH